MYMYVRTVRDREIGTGISEASKRASWRSFKVIKTKLATHTRAASTLDPAPCVAIIDLPAEIDDRQLAPIQGDKNEIGHTRACRLHTRPLRSQQSIEFAGQ